MDYTSVRGVPINRGALTARLQKCLDIKNNYPDSIVLFHSGRNGDYYSAYCKDATDIAVKLAGRWNFSLAHTQPSDQDESIGCIYDMTIQRKYFDGHVCALLLAGESVIVVESQVLPGEADRFWVYVASMTVSLHKPIAEASNRSARGC